MSTLIKRLRDYTTEDENNFSITHPICDEAADALQTLLDQLATAQSSVAVAMSQRRQVVLAAQALLALDLENDGATCEWVELQRAIADIRAAIAGKEPNAELTGAAGLPGCSG